MMPSQFAGLATFTLTLWHTTAISLAGYRKAICVNVGANSSSSRSWVPAYSTVGLSSASNNSGIKTALIIVHGLGRDADNYFGWAMSAATSLPGGLTRHAVIAPWFAPSAQPSGGSTKWIEAQAECGSGVGKSLSWASASGNPQSWLSCGDAQTTGGVYGSCDVLDALLQQLRDGKLLPDLELVTLAGFSAGGQLVHRYAFLSGSGSDNTDQVVGNDALYDASVGAVRFVVSDPSTYLYHDAKRPDVGVCSPLQDTGVAHACTAFGVPAHVSGSCGEYDDFKLGLAPGSLFGYAQRRLCPTTAAAADEAASCPTEAAVAEALANFLSKNLTLLLGGDDSCNCQSTGFINSAWCTAVQHGLTCCVDTYPDAGFVQNTTTGSWICPDNALATDCGAMLQGSNRLQRGLNYYGYLRAYGKVIDADFPDSGQLTCCIVDDMNHNASEMVRCADGLQQLFAPNQASCKKPCSKAKSTGIRMVHN